MIVGTGPGQGRGRGTGQGLGKDSVAVVVPRFVMMTGEGMGLVASKWNTILGADLVTGMDMKTVPVGMRTKMSLDMRYFDRPIAFHRAFVSLGGVKVALFLSQALYWTNRLPADRGGWFWKTGEEWRDETGMTREEIDTVRKRLKALGVLEERLAGIPAKLWYRVNASMLEDRLQTSVCEGPDPVCVKPTNCGVGNPQTITETTSENSSETTRGGGRAWRPIPPPPWWTHARPLLSIGLSARYRRVLTRRLSRRGGNTGCAVARTGSSGTWKAVVLRWRLECRRGSSTHGTWTTAGGRRGTRTRRLYQHREGRGVVVNRT